MLLSVQNRTILGSTRTGWLGKAAASSRLHSPEWQAMMGHNQSCSRTARKRRCACWLAPLIWIVIALRKARCFLRGESPCRVRAAGRRENVPVEKEQLVAELRAEEEKEPRRTCCALTMKPCALAGSPEPPVMKPGALHLRFLVIVLDRTRRSVFLDPDEGIGVDPEYQGLVPFRGTISHDLHIDGLRVVSWVEQQGTTCGLVIRSRFRRSVDGPVENVYGFNGRIRKTYLKDHVLASAIAFRDRHVAD